MDEAKKGEIIGFFMQKGILVSQDSLESLQDINLDQMYAALIKKIPVDQLTILHSDLIYLIKEDIEPRANQDINWNELEQLRARSERTGSSKGYGKFLDIIKQDEQPEVHTKDQIVVLYDYHEPDKKREVDDFVQHFNNRFHQIEKLFHGRQELSGLISISRISSKKDKEQIAFIGMVNNKKTSKNGNIILELEDTTGMISALVSKNKPDLFTLSQDIVNDEVIAVTGVSHEGIVS